MVAKGVGIIEALRQCFGSEFVSAFSALRSGSPYDYESGVSEYIRLESSAYLDFSSLDLLRDELNINLERIMVLGGGGRDLENNFRGAFSVWMRRYDEIIGSDAASESAFSAIRKLLDGTERSFAEAFKMLQKGFGLSAAVLAVMAGLVATGTGVGLVATINMWLFGTPWTAVLGLFSSAAFMFALSRIKVSQTSSMTMAIKLAYQLLGGKRGGR